ncbi:Hel [Koyama Hill virus]|uniref:Hel n=1 Tax=Koyama Hill virus TaxID=1435294 RepID=A0A077JF28_9REOV|nr:Hel [Koyama Hill virus]
MRIVLLAPGDIIKNSEPELKQRGIDVSVKDWIENDGSQLSEGEGKGGREGENGKQASANSGRRDGDVGRDGAESSGDGKANDDPRPGDSGRIRADGKRTVETESKTGDGGEIRDGKSASDKGSKNAKGNERSIDSTVITSEKVKEKEGTDSKIAEQLAEKRGDEPSGSNGHIYVLTRAVADAINQRSGTNLDVLKSLKDLGEGKKCYQISNGVGKLIGVDVDAVKEQIDALNELKAQYDGSNVNALLKRVVRIESGGKLDQVFPKGRDEKHMPGSGVVLATNDPKYIAQANAMFTCPTGDTNWKEVSRKATSKTSIRAYSYSEIGDGSEIKEAFLSLIDSL